MKDIDIILLNYNNHKDTLECINSINANCSLNYELIIVDNNSNDESLNQLKLNKKQNYHLIVSKQNKGFANGNNLGIQYALEKGINNILLLNNDTLITSGCIEKMKRILEEEKTGIVSCRILYYPDKEKIWYDGGKINWFKKTAIHINMGKYIEQCKENKAVKDVNFISGCCMLIKADVFNEIGLLPEEYFMYYEDLDFCIKVAEAGYKMKVLSNVIIYHKVSSSSGGEESAFSIKWGTRNRIILTDKYKYKQSYNHLILGKMFFYLTRFILAIKYLLNKDKDKYNALIIGINDGQKYVKVKKNK